MKINRIIDLYKSKRMTQEELAEKSGISKTTLSQILLGQSNPTVETIEKIADALSVPVSYFFDDEISQTGNNVTQTVHGNKNTLSNGEMAFKLELERLKEKVKVMQELIKSKDETIKEMGKRMQMLENILHIKHEK